MFLSVNPVEFHGPHLSLHNDRLISKGIIRDLHRVLAQERPDLPLLELADLEVGVDPASGPGSRPIPYRTVRDLVVRTCAALAELSPSGVVIMTFHGSPLHELALQAGVDYLMERGIPALAPLNILLQELLGLDGERYAPAVAGIADPVVRDELVRNLPHDFHAGFFETSLSLHYAPGSVDPGYRSLPPCPVPVPHAGFGLMGRMARRLGATQLAEELELAATGIGWGRIRPFPCYTSRPSCASPEAGAYFASEIVAKFAPVVRDVLAGQAAPPRPTMAWVRWLTLGGRLPTPQVPVDQVAADLPAGVAEVRAQGELVP